MKWQDGFNFGMGFILASIVAVPFFVACGFVLFLILMLFS